MFNGMRKIRETSSINEKDMDEIMKSWVAPPRSFRRLDADSHRFYKAFLQQDRNLGGQFLGSLYRGDTYDPVTMKNMRVGSVIKCRTPLSWSVDEGVAFRFADPEMPLMWHIERCDGECRVTRLPHNSHGLLEHLTPPGTLTVTKISRTQDWFNNYSAPGLQVNCIFKAGLPSRELARAYEQVKAREAHPPFLSVSNPITPQKRKRTPLEDKRNTFEGKLEALWKY